MPLYRPDLHGDLIDAVRQLMAQLAELDAAMQAVEKEIAPARTSKAPVVLRVVKNWDAVKKTLTIGSAQSRDFSSHLEETARAIDEVLK